MPRNYVLRPLTVNLPSAADRERLLGELGATEVTIGLNLAVEITPGIPASEDPPPGVDINDWNGTPDTASFGLRGGRGHVMATYTGTRHRGLLSGASAFFDNTIASGLISRIDLPFFDWGADAQALSAAIQRETIRVDEVMTAAVEGGVSWIDSLAVSTPFGTLNLPAVGGGLGLEATFRLASPEQRAEVQAAAVALLPALNPQLSLAAQHAIYDPAGAVRDRLYQGLMGEDAATTRAAWGYSGSVFASFIATGASAPEYVTYGGWSTFGNLAPTTSSALLEIHGRGESYPISVSSGAGEKEYQAIDVKPNPDSPLGFRIIGTTRDIVSGVNQLFLLNHVFQYLGVFDLEFPAILPNLTYSGEEDLPGPLDPRALTLRPPGEGDPDAIAVRVASLPQQLAHLLDQVDSTIGQFPVKIKIADTNPLTKEKEEEEIVVPNMAEFMAELYSLSVESMQNSIMTTGAIPRLAFEIVGAKNAAIVAQSYAAANAGYLGYRGNQVEKKVPYAFDLEDTDEKTLLDLYQEAEGTLLVMEEQEEGSVFESLSLILAGTEVSRNALTRSPTQVLDLIDSLVRAKRMFGGGSFDPNDPGAADNLRDLLSTINDSGFFKANDRTPRPFAREVNLENERGDLWR
ncbi:MAG: hypothetical protein ACFB9N_05125 [Geitlerinemataceae cyanobacterium]